MVGFGRRKSAKAPKEKEDGGKAVDRWEYFGIAFNGERFREIFENRIYKSKKKANKVLVKKKDKKLKGKNPKVVQVYGD